MPAAFAFAHGDESPDAAALADTADDALEPGVVHAGISMGVMQAQRLAQTRPGAAGAVLLEACVPTTGDGAFGPITRDGAFGPITRDGAFGPWPAGVPVRLHGMDDDEFFAHEADVEAARALVEACRRG